MSRDTDLCPDCVPKVEAMVSESARFSIRNTWTKARPGTTTRRSFLMRHRRYGQDAGS